MMDKQVITYTEISRVLYRRGVSIFPIPYGSKKANQPWKQYQTEPPTEDQIEKWFGNGTPSNIAIVTGFLSELVVVDADNDEAVAWVEAKLPKTPIWVRTAKGIHYYYRHPAKPIRNKVKIPTSEGDLSIDVRGDGGYVIGPGSRHPSGAIYEPCDAFLDDKSWESIPTFETSWLEGPYASNPNYKKARLYLNNTPGAVEGNGGDNQTFKVACKLIRGFGLSDEEALNLMHEWNKKCSPPWNQIDLEAKLKNARDYGNEPFGSMVDDQTEEINEQDKDLYNKYGPFIMYGKGGIPVQFNQMYAAGNFAEDNLVLHEPSLNLFYEYDDSTGLWKSRTESSLAIDLGRALHQMLIRHHANNLLKKRSEPLLTQILRLLKGIVERPEVFRHTTPIIHVGNGVLHIDCDPPTLNEFSPDYYSRNRSEVCYDEGAECPRFIDELLAPALSLDDISLLQRYAGQCLLGRNPSQKLLLLRGMPGGGKSTLANVLEAVIGTYNVTQLRVQHLSERFEIAGFVGKTLLTGKDVPGDFLNNKSAYYLKALVGGDRLDAEQKNVKHRFEVYGEFNVIITSNSRLHVRLDADSGAWRRRLIIVDYERPATDKPIPNFDRLLVETEGPGILNWCVAGAINLLDELKIHGRMQLSDAQMERVDALLSESDSVRHFIKEMVQEADGRDVTVHELATSYHNFCDEQGWQAVTVRQFENQVSNIMMEVHRVAKRTDIRRDGKNSRGFSHVALKES